MIKKLFITTLFIFLLIGSCWADDPPSWDLLNEDCSDISDWTDTDTGDGISEVSPAGQFNLYNTSTVGGHAARTQDIGTYPTDGFTVEIKIYHDTLGARADNDYFMLQMRTANIRIDIEFATDGLFTNDGDVWNEVGTNIVDTGVWTIWRFLIDDTDDTMDVYKNGVLMASNVDISQTGSFTSGQTFIIQEGSTVITGSHMDYLKAATGLYVPTPSVAVGQIIWIN